MPKRKYTDSTDRWDVAEDIGCTPGHLNGGGLSAEQRTALKYYCRRWLGKSVV